MSEAVEIKPEDLTIPQVREELEAIADSIERALPVTALRLRVLAASTRRRFHGRKARAKALHVTEDMAERVRAYCKAHPDLSNREVGRAHGIDGGRVSEILYGKRGER
jgi:hypothetical protein